jgi:hypothetical protein
MKQKRLRFGVGVGEEEPTKLKKNLTFLSWFASILYLEMQCLVVWKVRESQGIAFCQMSGNPVLVS